MYARIPEISNNYGAPLVLVVGVALLDNDVWSGRVSRVFITPDIPSSLSLSLARRETHTIERDTHQQHTFASYMLHT